MNIYIFFGKQDPERLMEGTLLAAPSPHAGLAALLHDGNPFPDKFVAKTTRRGFVGHSDNKEQADGEATGVA